MNDLYQLTLKNAAKAVSYDILLQEEKLRQENELNNWWNQLDQDEQAIEEMCNE